MTRRCLAIVFVLLAWVTPAQAAFRASTTNSGNSTTPTCTVPAGAAANDIAIISSEMDSTSASYVSAVFTTIGFTRLDSVVMTGVDGQAIGLGWKRLSGADSGSYVLGNVGATGDWICQVWLFSGRDTGNPPVNGTQSVVDTPTNSPVSVSINGVTALANDDVLWIVMADIALATPVFSLTAVPASYTSNTNQTANWCGGGSAYREAVSAGATGALTGTFTSGSSTNGYTGWTVRIPVSGGGGGTTTTPGLLTVGVGL